MVAAFTAYFHWLNANPVVKSTNEKKGYDQVQVILTSSSYKAPSLQCSQGGIADYKLVLTVLLRSTILAVFPRWYCR